MVEYISDNSIVGVVEEIEEIIDKINSCSHSGNRLIISYSPLR